MSAATSIEWTDRSWNPVVGCSLVSPGCTNCYAMRMAARLQAMGVEHYQGLTRKVNGQTVWTGVMRAAPDHVLAQPLHWRRPQRIFVNSMSDLFAEENPDELIDRAFAVMSWAHWHKFQVLTKRSERMRAYINSLGPRLRHVLEASRSLTHHRLDAPGSYRPRFPLPNVWLGVSAEDQPRAEERVPHLMATPAAVRFVSAEPLLGRIRFTRLTIGDELELDALRGLACATPSHIAIPPKPLGAKIDWVIAGGESGPGARPMHPDWARGIRDDCAAARVPFFFKQWGEWGPDQVAGGRLLKFLRPSGASGGFFEHGAAVVERRGKRAAGRALDGLIHDAMPAVR
jgi:protein gp37